MLKQSVVQEKISDLTSSNQLPPLSTLPQWSRVNTLDRGRYPKPFVKDKLQPIVDKNGEEEEKVDLTELNPSQRIHHLERSMIFLKQQHTEVLHSLHEEIDSLKKENKDLQFKIVMSQKQQQHQQQQNGTTSASSRVSRKDGQGLEKETSSLSLQSGYIYKALESSSREDKLDELKIIFLEEEIKELKHALRESRNRNNYLTNLVEQVEDEKKKQLHTIEMLKYQASQGNAVSLAEQVASGVNLFNQPGGKTPTLAECEAIIRQLQQINEKQHHELESLKSDLRDVLYSHKWTPDAYLLAQAYIAEDDAKDSEHKDKSLPKLPLKNPTRKLPEISYIQHKAVALPALKQTVSNKAIERKKRTQILQKSRLKKEVMQ